MFFGYLGSYRLEEAFANAYAQPTRKGFIRKGAYARALLSSQGFALDKNTVAKVGVLIEIYRNLCIR